MKKLFILFSVFLVFLSITVPCLADDVTIESGIYHGKSLISLSNLSSAPVDLPFYYIKNGVRYDCVGMTFYFRDGVEVIGFFDMADGTRLNVYDRYWLDTAYQTIYIPDDYQYSPSVDQGSFNSIFTSIFTKLSPINDDQPLITDIFSLFGYVGVWLGSAFSSLQAIFIADGALTVVGTLSVMGLAFAVILLLFNLIRSFLKYR